MKSHLLLVVSVLAFAGGCAAKNGGTAPMDPRSIELTVPNGSSPVKANAPHAPMNDELRNSNWNHGNSALWVMLPTNGVVTASELERDGWLRVKFPWWRGVRGQLTVEGRRLDAPAPPMRCDAATIAQNGDLGLNPCLLFFPTEGYWEITGRVGDRSLTFVVRVLKPN
jgi:hypothetical protein